MQIEYPPTTCPYNLQSRLHVTDKGADLITFKDNQHKNRYISLRSPTLAVLRTTAKAGPIVTYPARK
jgi:hypothetical protein